MRTPGRNSPTPSASRVILSAASGNSSVSSPNPGIAAVQPQSAGTTSRISTSSVSPGSCARDRDRPRDLVDAREVERQQVGGRGRRVDLAARRVEDIERDHLAGADLQDRRDGPSPRRGARYPDRYGMACQVLLMTGGRRPASSGWLGRHRAPRMAACVSHASNRWAQRSRNEHPSPVAAPGRISPAARSARSCAARRASSPGIDASRARV